MTANFSSEQEFQPILINKRERKSEGFPFGNCRICHDIGTGVHYGVISCEGCKGFFKRYTTQNILLQCSFDNKCIINFDTRNQCRACRFNRCLEEGMSMSNVKMGRIPKKIKEKALEKYYKHQDKSKDLSISTDHLTFNLSLLCLPTIFYSSSSSSNSLTYNNDITKSDENILTISKYISNINKNNLISYDFYYSKNILQIMKYLLPKLCQPFFIYELDIETMSFFRYLRLKVLNFYLKHTIKIRNLIQRMFGLINLNIDNYPGINATYEQMWNDIQANISTNIKEFLEFTQNIPALNELNLHDLNRILNTRIFDYWIILNYPLFYKNESYIMTSNGLQYTRKFMNKFIGKFTTDAIHKFCEQIHTLNITQIEHSLIIPIIICQPDQQFIDSESIHVIKHCYMYALYIQLCSTRTEDQAKKLFYQIVEIIDYIRVINELCRKNIGEIILNKSQIV